MAGGPVSFEELYSYGFSAVIRPCSGLFLFETTFLSSSFLTTLLHYSSVWFFLLFHLYCSHARDMCEIHTPCMESRYAIVHAKCSLIFRSVNNSHWPINWCESRILFENVSSASLISQSCSLGCTGIALLPRSTLTHGLQWTQLPTRGYRNFLQGNPTIY